jgi:hypothetical protein
MQHRRGGGGESTAMVLKKDGTKISLSRPGGMTQGELVPLATNRRNMGIIKNI